MLFTNKHFHSLFSPKRLAIIGASSNTDKVGYAILKNMIDAAFKGEVIPINPKAQEILGKRTWRDINEVQGQVDAAIIVLKASLVPQVLDDCGNKGVRSVVIISAGFIEMGSDAGQRLQKRVQEIAARHGMLVIGPNCLGVINTDPVVSMNATFSRAIPTPGNIAFISQSGAIGIHALEFAHDHDIGFSKFITIGNKAVTNENDLIQFLYNDLQTKVIMIYLESFADGIAFREVVDRLGHQKPIIMLKAGRSESGTKAALSHTGALASSDKMITYFLRDCGVLRVDTMAEMFATAMVMANQPLPGGDRVAILTNAGGLGIMAADAAEKFGLKMVSISADIQHALMEHLPQAASVGNPIDILGDADPVRYRNALEVLVASSDVDMIQIICTPQFMTDRLEVLRGLKDGLRTAKDKGIPVVAVFPAINEQGLTEQFDAFDLPFYEFPETAVKALSNYVGFRNYSTLTRPKKVDPGTMVHSIRDGLIKDIEAGKGHLNEAESYRILEAYDMQIAAYAVVQNEQEALTHGKELGYPLVAKIIATGVIHKYDIGGVILGIKSDEQVIDAFKRIRSAVSAEQFRGVLLQKQVKGGVELIAGTAFHPGFGHAVMFGLGGTNVEVMEDVAFAMTPLTKTKAMELIFSTKGSKLLTGFRGRAALPIPPLVDLLMGLSRIVSDIPEIRSMDLNPVFLTEQGVVVADARLILMDRSTTKVAGR